MARPARSQTRNGGSRPAQPPAATRNGAAASHGSGLSNAKNNTKNSWAHLFSEMACQTAHLAGKPLTFLVATVLIVIWAATGPLFGFSDTWQLIVNTTTTIITFLMVFLIQHTQNRDTLALQLKLAELVIAMRGAENSVAVAEDLSEEELERLHEDLRSRAKETLEHLERRRSSGLKRAG